MLQLRNINWSTESGVPIIKDLSLDIPDGRLTVVTGPNGGGKTSLAKIIAGIYTPDSGSVILDGKDITSLDVTERANLGVSYAFQQPVRFKGITVRKLIELSAGKSFNENSICDILARVGLCAREYIDREINSTLSGGEIKRIEIATVLARHSRISVFDEPEAGIDLWSFANLISVFNGIRADLDGTLLVISHQERILKIADEIIVIANGSLRARGTPDEIMNKLSPGNEVFGSCIKQEEILNK